MPRCKERIKVVLDNIDISDFISYLGFDNSEKYVKVFKENMSSVLNYWSENPDLRLTQVLIGLGILPNSHGSWYYTEEVDYLLEKNIVPPEKILFWGTYGKSGKGPLKWVSINEMESDHIEACLKTQAQMNDLYRITMIKVLRRRKLNYIYEKSY